LVFRSGGGAGDDLGARTILASDSVPADAASVASDVRLVERVLGGDQDAYRELVDRESRALVRVCYRILGDLHEAEDAAQEAFVTAYRALPSWRAEGPLGGWLSRIAVRIALRMAGRRRPVTWIDPSASETAAAQLARLDGGHGQDPAPGYLAVEQAASVRAAVARLDEPYREVVALRFFADLSLAEIAGQTGRPLGTVKTHLHRGLQRLRREMDPEAPA
jgi:RNA polymerase sigma-70 factor (ECF subfamily)